MFTPFVMTIACPGALAANFEYHFTVLAPFTVEQLSMKCSNAGSLRVKLGTNSDDDEFLTYTNVGSSLVEVGDAITDWRYDAKPHYVAGDVFEFTVDFDGAGGTAGEDFTATFTCTPG